MIEAPTWLMLINSVSGENKSARMRIWRALKSSGAGALRDGVYVLPNSKSARAVFEEQAEEVVAAGGAAHILPLDTHEAAQQREFARLFDRGADYASCSRGLPASRQERRSSMKSRRAARRPRCGATWPR
jgi:hypothetical protein